ncbi:MAG: iron ABC transporter permease [Oceanospirillaceae bacterium]|nr:iron ABC transporter permease [Oceanospirillaceae bacterium]
MSRPLNSDQFTLQFFQQRLALRVNKTVIYALALVTLLLFALMLWSLFVGSYQLSIAQVIATLTNPQPGSPSSDVIWLFRFPRTLAAILVGIMMALSGAVLQNITRNSLADPSLVGISQGAALAVVVAIIAFPDLDKSYRSVLAFAGSTSVAALIMLLSHSKHNHKPMRFILLGIALSAFLSAVTTAYLTYGQLYQASAALGWLAGNIDGVNWLDVKILCYSSLCLLPILLIQSRAMAVVRLGDTNAIALGVNLDWMKYSLVATSVALAATATSVVGPIGFIGLIAPHAARRVCTSGVMGHLLLSALIGGLLLLVADVLGRRLIAPSQLPAGVLTQIIGVPIFVYLLLRKKTLPSS